MNRTVFRRAAAVAVVALAIVSTSVACKPAPVQAFTGPRIAAPLLTPPTLLKPRRVIFGTSVTRISNVQIHAAIPYSIIDGWDNANYTPNPGTYYQMDGRGLYTPPTNGGLTIEQGYHDQINRGVLRSGDPNHDFAVFETSRGLEDPALMAPVVVVDELKMKRKSGVTSVTGAAVCVAARLAPFRPRSR